jgi:hypothetical protein
MRIIDPLYRLRAFRIASQQRTIADAKILTQGQAVKYCGPSNLTIQKLIRAGILKMKQVVPWAPWEIERSDLDSTEVQAIMDRLRKTGKLVLQGSLRDPRI